MNKCEYIVDKIIKTINQNKSMMINNNNNDNKMILKKY